MVTAQRALANGRIRPAFHFQSLHSQFNPATLRASAEPYHSYQIYQPEATFTPWRGADREEVTISVGLRLQRFTIPSPGVNREASHALVNTLRYQRVWGEDSTAHAEYKLSAALGGLGSDYRFTRHEFNTGVAYAPGRHQLRLALQAGAVGGDAPLYDRFAYGNSTTLRGWNKFDLAPLGATRAAAGTIEYGRRFGHEFYLSAFLDSGSVWNRNGPSPVRNSSGVGVRTKEGFFFYVAFPFRSGGVEPVFMTGACF